MKLIFASHNSNKVAEIAQLMPAGITLLSLADLNFEEEIIEDGLTIEENALKKARHIHQLTQLNVFADDTGLEVEALNGAPGVHSARYAGIQKNDADNINKLLDALKNTTARSAQFKTCIAAIINNSETLHTGLCKGAVSQSPSGLYGFGYDSIFVPDGASRSFADMMLEQKNKFSHRAKAFALFIQYINQNI